MTDSFFQTLTMYYGLDWLSMLIGFAGGWLVTSQNRWGFLLVILSTIFAAATAIMASQYGFILANIINILISTRGFIAWKKRDRSVQGVAA